MHTDEKMKESIAFLEMKNYIEKSVSTGTSLFKLSELHQVHTNRLQAAGIEKSINKTRFKTQILDQFPDAKEQHDGKNIIIVFNEGMKDIMKRAVKIRDFNEDADTLNRAAKIIRKDIFDHDGFKFEGAFEIQCQEDAIPTSLIPFISRILYGASF